MSACPACKFENPAGRRFCQNCGSALAPPPEIQPSLGTDERVTLTAELEQVKQEARRLAQLLDDREKELRSANEEIARIINLPPAPAADHAAIEQLQKQLAAAEDDRQKLTQELAAAHQQANAGPNAATGGLSARKRMGLAVGSLILASATGLGGFKYGQIDPDKSHREKQQQLATQLASEHSQVQDLQAQLNAARQNVDQLTTQVSARAREAQDATGKMSKLQHDLSAAQDSLAQKTQSERQARQQLQTATQNTNQMSQDLAAKTSLVNTQQEILNKHPGWTYKGPTEGTITWAGEIRDEKKKVTVTIERNGQVTVDPKGAGSLSGDWQLPKLPVAVQPLDKDVHILPQSNPKSAGGKISFQIEGKGTKKVTVYWFVR
jgi:hypothetical protein